MMTADMKVTGRFDGTFAAGARPIFERLAKELRDVTVDMSETTDLDAAGLGALVNLHKGLEPYGCKVRVLGANGRLRGLFVRFHLADLFIEGAAKLDSTALRCCFFGVRPPAPVAIKHVIAAKAEPAGTASRSIKAWLDASTLGGGELRGGDALKSYRRWAGKPAEAGDATGLRANLAAIIGADRVISRKSGYVVKGIQLRRPIALGKGRQGAAAHLLFAVPATTAGVEAIPAVSA